MKNDDKMLYNRFFNTLFIFILFKLWKYCRFESYL